jgi:acyl-CoA synthetase (AMP-forming)/AMP-acid ligase II
MATAHRIVVRHLRDVRIVDAADRELPPGEAGEIVCRPLRPHAMFEGYWKRPDATASAMRNLWFHTGDMGKFERMAASTSSTARRTT